MNIDTRTYDKTTFGVGNGWDKRTIDNPKTILIHTVNGRKGTTLRQEANFIFKSPYISAHYLIGKAGQKIQFLDPKLRAWHAGAVYDQLFNNNNSAGIEAHVTVGEVWTTDQIDALSEVCLYLISTYGITSPGLIQTHRHVARPNGRKIDPSGYPFNDDVWFNAWRASLFTTVRPKEIKYRVIAPEINIRQAPYRQNKPSNIAGVLYKGDVFYSIAQKKDERGEFIKGLNIWVHVTYGKSRGNDVSGLGFVHMSNLTIIG